MERKARLSLRSFRQRPRHMDRHSQATKQRSTGLLRHLATRPRMQQLHPSHTPRLQRASHRPHIQPHLTHHQYRRHQQVGSVLARCHTQLLSHHHTALRLNQRLRVQLTRKHHRSHLTRRLANLSSPLSARPSHRLRHHPTGALAATVAVKLAQVRQHRSSCQNRPRVNLLPLQRRR